uniref:C-type lectin domain-containing protein n=1 Tax=Peromyscus maniculatus bairdii TaxID=230844 RepID=A0A8C8UPQ3_PERMB
MNQTPPFLTPHCSIRSRYLPKGGHFNFFFRNHSRADFNSDHTSLTPKMSDEIIYTTVRFHKSSSELQNKERPDENEGSREAGHRGKCFKSFLVLYLLLISVFQYTQEKHELQKALNNLHQKYSTMQNASYLMEEMWKNKSIEYDACKDHPASLNRKQNRCCGETEVVLDLHYHRIFTIPFSVVGKRVEGYWFCTGIKCYYFIMDNKPWIGCKQTCRDCSLSLLNIENNDELKFLQLQIKLNRYWIGLKYNRSKGKWQWIGDVPSKLDLNTVKLNHNTGRCALLSRTRLDNDNCDQLYPCICEKRLDKFPDSLFSRS